MCKFIRKSLLASAVAAGVGFGSLASGAVSIVVSDLGVPNDGNSGTTQANLVGYHAYLVQADAGAGAVITAVDFSSSAGRAFNTTLHQAWFVSQNRTLTASVSPNSDVSVNNSGPNSTNLGDDSYDSHFVFPSMSPNYQLVAGTLNENNDAYNTSTNTRSTGSSPFFAFNGTGTGEAYGNGTVLSAAYALVTNTDANGVTTTSQARLVNIAYLVIPDSLHLTGPLTVANGQVAASNSNGILPVIIPALVSAPEPTSLGAIGLSLLALKRRNRRA